MQLYLGSDFLSVSAQTFSFFQPDPKPSFKEKILFLQPGFIADQEFSETLQPLKKKSFLYTILMVLFQWKNLTPLEMHGTFFPLT